MSAVIRILLAFLVVVATVSRGSAVGADETPQPEDSLRIYGVRLFKTPPLSPPFTGHAIYLGHGAFLSAAHVVGRWPLFSQPRILVAGQDLPATVVKMGFSEGVDLTLLTVDEKKLPLAMRLRRTPICKTPPVAGEEVFGVSFDKVAPTTILSPLYVAPEYRERFGTLTASVVTASGSGIFRARTKCLLGIVSKSVPRLPIEASGDTEDVGLRIAGYFEPAAKILQFLPKEFRY